LSRILVDPISAVVQRGDMLVFVHDPALGCLPFGALKRADGRYLIEEHPVVVTGSTTAWVQSLHRKRRASRALLSVGNPLPDEQTVPLAGAEAEAKEVAALYPSRALLIGASATKKRVISNLAYCDSAHFAVHANAGLDEAMQPHLTLSETKDDDGRLTAAEIAALELDHIRTVVLAGCRTAAGRRSLVEAFLAAGAGSVVGTLWDVDDAATREMSITLHRSLRDGATPAAALRATQIDMIRRAASPRVWASLQLYGSGS
jgi:CHAT domain-containing protein